MRRKDINKTRFMGRLGLDLYLRVSTLIGDLFEGDLISGLVFYATARANVRHMNSPRRLSPLAEKGVFPDHLRIPVSAFSVAKGLGLPRETVRRHMRKLLDAGLCEQGEDGGYVVPAAVLAGPKLQRLSTMLEAELIGIIDDLAYSGIILPQAVTEDEADDAG